jgi:hypothetical protein
MNNNASKIIHELESAWRCIQKLHPDVPDVVIVTSRRRSKGEKTIRGQHCTNVWHTGAEHRLADVTVFGERLADGPTAVLNTLIHEAVHAVANKRDAKDTSNKGRYHNKVFVKIAEEMGLEGPKQSGGPALGYSDCKITDATVEVYKDVVERLSAISAFVPANGDMAEVKTKKPTKKAKCACEDDDMQITWTKAFEKRFQNGLFILCGVCRSAYEPIDEGEL